MRKIFLLLCCCFHFLCYSQDSLVRQTADSVCICINELSIQSFSAEMLLNECFEKFAFQQSGNRDISFVKSINRELVAKCDIFFKIIDTLRFSSIRSIPTIKLLDSLNSLNTNSGKIDSLILEKKGVIFFALNQLDSSLSFFNMILESNPSNFNALYYKSAILEHRGKYNEAIQILEKMEDHSRVEIGTMIEVIKRKRKK